MAHFAEMITQFADIDVIYCDGLSINVKTDETKELAFRHSEADTMLFSIHAEMGTKKCSYPFVIDRDHTDIYVLAPYASQKLDNELLIMHKKTIVDCFTLLPVDIANIIIPLHVITGGDHTSGFYGQGIRLY